MQALHTVTETQPETPGTRCDCTAGAATCHPPAPPQAPLQAPSLHIRLSHDMRPEQMSSPGHASTTASHMTTCSHVCENIATAMHTTALQQAQCNQLDSRHVFNSCQARALSTRSAQKIIHGPSLR